MRSIKFVMCCFVALALLFAGCSPTERDSAKKSQPDASPKPVVASKSNSMAETKNVSAQEYLANSIKMEAGQPAKDQIQDLYDEMDFQRAGLDLPGEGVGTG